MPNFRNQLDQYLRREANPEHKYSHQPRLYALTQQIADLTPSLTYDGDIIYAAAFLHDLGVFVGHRPEDPDQLKQWNHNTPVPASSRCIRANILPPMALSPTQKTR